MSCDVETQGTANVVELDVIMKNTVVAEGQSKLTIRGKHVVPFGRIRAKQPFTASFLRTDIAHLKQEYAHLM